MSYVTLVTGGARSGKSSFAEEQMLREEKVCYIATGVTRQDDLEMQDRIKRHQAQRPQHWVTHEGFLGLPEWLKQQQEPQSYLFDCATLFTTNYFFHLLEHHLKIPQGKLDQAIEDLTMTDFHLLEGLMMAEWREIIEAIQQVKGSDVFLVTNEIGLGLVPETKFGRLFRDLLGRVNQYLAKEADAVYFVVSGLPQQLK